MYINETDLNEVMTVEFTSDSKGLTTKLSRLVPEEKVHEDKYSFPRSRVGVLVMKNSKGNKKDLLDILAEMSKPARDFFVALKCRTDRRTNIAVIPKPSGATERGVRAKATKELIKFNLIHKDGIRKFMINPKFIQPALTYLFDSHMKWYQLTGEILSPKIAEKLKELQEEADSYQEPKISETKTVTPF